MKRRGKEILSIILTIIMAVMVYSTDISAARVKKMSTEDISKIVGNFNVGEQVTAVEDGYYEFSVPSNGKLQIQESSETEKNIGYHIYTGPNKEIVGGVIEKYWIRLKAGTYYVYMHKDDILTLSFIDESLGNYEKEENDNFDTATEIQVNQMYIGNSQISGGREYFSAYYNGYGDTGKLRYYYSEDKDYYHFSLNQKGTVYVDFSQIHNQDDRGHTLELYQEDLTGNLTTILSEKILINNGKTTRTRVSGGSYYLGISCIEEDSAVNLQDYSFQVYYKEEDNTTELEPNNTREQANEIMMNTSYTGNIASTNEKIDEDWYKINVQKECKGRIKFTIPRQTEDGMFTVELYSSLGIKMDSFKTTQNPVSYSSENPKKYTEGTYYIKVFGTNDKTFGTDNIENEISSDSFVDYSLQFIDSSMEEDKTENIDVTEISKDDTIFNIDDTDLVAYIPNETLMVGETENIIFNQSLNCNYDIQVTNQNIAYVDEMGVLHAISSGTTFITINTDIGKTASFEITVIESSKNNYNDNLDFDNNEEIKSEQENIQKIPEGVDIEVVEDILNTTTDIISVRNIKGKVMQLRLDSFNKFDGYEIQYSTKKSMESSKKVTSKTRKLNIKKLKKKKYYIRARVYGKLSGKKYYGSWSAIKIIKIKK